MACQQAQSKCFTPHRRLATQAGKVARPVEWTVSSLRHIANSLAGRVARGTASLATAGYY
jgi:hypothetical protein